MRKRLKCDDERSCPECSRRWAAQEGTQAEWRIAHLTYRKGRHFSVSFDGFEPAHSAESYAAMFTAAWDLLRRLGAKGAALVYHGWRKRRNRNGPVTWYVSPHLHAIVLGPVNTWRLAAGAVVVNVQAKRAREAGCCSVPEQASVAGTVSYLLDHCGYVDGRHAIRYYGALSYNRLPVPPLPTEDRLLCPQCGRRMERFDPFIWNSDGEIVGSDEWRG